VGISRSDQPAVPWTGCPGGWIRKGTEFVPSDWGKLVSRRPLGRNAASPGAADIQAIWPACEAVRVWERRWGDYGPDAEGCRPGRDAGGGASASGTMRRCGPPVGSLATRESWRNGCRNCGCGSRATVPLDDLRALALPSKGADNREGAVGGPVACGTGVWHALGEAVRRPGASGGLCCATSLRWSSYETDRPALCACAGRATVRSRAEFRPGSRLATSLLGTRRAQGARRCRVADREIRPGRKAEEEMLESGAAGRVRPLPSRKRWRSDVRAHRTRWTTGRMTGGIFVIRPWSRDRGATAIRQRLCPMWWAQPGPGSSGRLI